MLSPEINCMRSSSGGVGGGGRENKQKKEVNAISCNLLQCIRVILLSASVKEPLWTLPMGENWEGGRRAV